MHVRINFGLFPCLLSLCVCLSHSDIAYSKAWRKVWILFRILTSRQFCFSFLLLLASDLMQLSTRSFTEKLDTRNSNNPTHAFSTMNSHVLKFYSRGPLFSPYSMCQSSEHPLRAKSAQINN